jgi:hypothetical protein
MNINDPVGWCVPALCRTYVKMSDVYHTSMPGEERHAGVLVAHVPKLSRPSCSRVLPATCWRCPISYQLHPAVATMQMLTARAPGHPAMSVSQRFPYSALLTSRCPDPRDYPQDGGAARVVGHVPGEARHEAPICLQYARP